MFEPSSNQKRIPGRHRPRRTMLARPPRRSKAQRGALARAGATLVEFAIVCNILLLTIFMCMELARMNMARNLAQDAAYYAARTAIVPGATAEEARQEAETIMQSLFANGYEIECTEIDDDAEEVTVTVSINLDDVALFTPMFLGNIQLTSSATMQTERYNGFFRVDN
ncbi:pilus assembly protein [Rhodopirellula sp. JC740]|uniref:Pilus assembly protein n=1 Tax=Rhodopirellula halodulae TaxID=2894198 RepID=A0ABS8NLJ1_9BACT|nr:TadE/TadG family type IV pilus assembly protein [Rhodopirellula sp. JC740]MCC9644438.1 pilus assembly protein [Rhodopirellula sp. JC740]